MTQCSCIDKIVREKTIVTCTVKHVLSNIIKFGEKTSVTYTAIKNFLFDVFFILMHFLVFYLSWNNGSNISCYKLRNDDIKIWS